MLIGNRSITVAVILIFCTALLFSLVLPEELFGTSLLTELIGAGLIATAAIPVLRFLFVLPLREESEGRKKAEDESSLAFKVLEASSEPILITDPDANIEYVNRAFSEVTGYQKEEVLGKNPRIMKSGRQDDEFYREFWDSLQETGHWQGVLWDRRKNGEEYPKWLSVSSVKDGSGEIIKYVGVFSDITALKQTEEHIEYLTQYDSLTGLPNRMLFRERLNEEIDRGAQTKRLFALVLLGVGKFANIKDTFGQLAGDFLLKDFAGRLLGCLGENDILARLEVDEFAMVLTDLDSRHDVILLARQIIEELSRPFLVNNRHEVFLDAKMGITLYPGDGNDIEILMKNAQIALHQVKQGDKAFRFFDPSMSSKAFEHLSLEANLRRAIKNEEFVLHYQPQVDLSSGRIIGMEALIRRTENNWLVPPSMFIPLAEETGLIIPICEWTLLTACIQSKKWQDAGLVPLRLAINVTAGQFYQKTLIPTVQDALDRSGLSPGFLELELTERIIVHDAEEAIKMMKELKDMGVNLSIDDFGTGYSSLSYLRRFPIDKLKIDISFVRDIGVDPNSESIVRAVIALSHSLNLKAIAEGVENKTQLEFLQEHGCDEIQGYYFSVPLPSDAFRDLVKSGRTFR